MQTSSAAPSNGHDSLLSTRTQLKKPVSKCADEDSSVSETRRLLAKKLAASAGNGGSSSPLAYRPDTTQFGWLRILRHAVFFAALALFKSGFSFYAFAAANEGHGGEGEESESALPKEAQIVLAIILIILTAIFAGLTIGIMGVDTLTLEIIAEGGTEPDSTYAKTLLPVRKLGHHALATLVLGNMWANVMIAQFCADINPEEGGGGEGVGGLVAFLMSTLIILVFGEILPMSVCKSSQALRVAAAGVPVLKVFIVLLYPIAKPLGVMLDWMVHHDVGQIYDRNELMELMKLHANRLASDSGLDKDEGNMLVGVLEFKDKAIGSIMTRIEDTICVSEDCIIDRDLLRALWAVGRSRVPIVKGTVNTPISINDPRSLVTTAMKQNIVGILYIKDLITFNAPDATVRQYLSSEQQREVRHVATTDTLPKVMALAQTGVAHMFVVREPPSGSRSTILPSLTGPREVMDPNGGLGKVVGICTMEDVLEALIKSEILDENDQEDDDDVDGAAPPTGHTVGAIRRSKASRVNMYTFYIPPSAAAKGEPIAVNPLTEVERAAVGKFLMNTVPAFAFWKPAAVRALLAEATDEVIMPPPAAASPSSGDSAPGSPTSANLIAPTVFLKDLPPKNIVCRKGNAVTEFILVLTGCIEVCFSATDGFKSEITTMGFLGESVLMDGKGFVPSFSARIAKRPTRVLRIPYTLYQSHERRMQLAAATGAFTDTFTRNNAPSNGISPIVSRSNPTGASPATVAARAAAVDDIPRPTYVSRFSTSSGYTNSGGQREASPSSNVASSPTPLTKA